MREDWKSCKKSDFSTVTGHNISTCERQALMLGLCGGTDLWHSWQYPPVAVSLSTIGSEALGNSTSRRYWRYWSSCFLLWTWPGNSRTHPHADRCGSSKEMSCRNGSSSAFRRDTNRAKINRYSTTPESENKSRRLNITYFPNKSHSLSYSNSITLLSNLVLRPFPVLGVGWTWEQALALPRFVD